MRSLILMCLTLLIAIPKANADTIVDFKNWQEAKDFYLNHYANDLTNRSERVENKIDFSKVYDQHDEVYRRVTYIVEKLDHGFQKYFVQTRSFKHAPYIIIVDAEYASAMALNGDSAGVPYLILITKGILKSTDDELAGVLAHELTHLLLQLPTPNPDKTKYYFRTDNRILFGPEITNDKYAELALSTYANDMHAFGFLSAKEFDGLPLREAEDMPFNHYNLLEDMIKERQSQTDCINAEHSLTTLRTQLSKKIDADTLEVKIVHQKKLAADIKFVESNLIKCLAGVKISYVELIKNYISVTPEQLTIMAKNKSPNWADFNATAALFDKYDAVHAFFKAARLARAKIRRMDSQLNISRMASYTIEDQADEIGTYMLLQLGFQPTALGDFLMRDLEHRKQCDLSKEPPYGQPDVGHHLDCWRIYRNKKFVEHLQSLSQDERDHYYEQIYDKNPASL